MINGYYIPSEAFSRRRATGIRGTWAPNLTLQVGDAHVLHDQGPGNALSQDDGLSQMFTSDTNFTLIDVLYWIFALDIISKKKDLIAQSNTRMVEQLKHPHSWRWNLSSSALHGSSGTMLRRTVRRAAAPDRPRSSSSAATSGAVEAGWCQVAR